MSKLWIMSVGIDKYDRDHKDRRDELDSERKHRWSVRKTVEPNDLILFYYKKSENSTGSIKSIFKITTTAKLETPDGWTKRGYDYLAGIERITKAKHINPIPYEEIMQDKSFSSSHFVAMNMSGRFDATQYWGRFYEILIQNNPDLKETLSKYSPEKIYQ
jgi:hypothetical protein